MSDNFIPTEEELQALAQERADAERRERWKQENAENHRRQEQREHEAWTTIRAENQSLRAAQWKWLAEKLTGEPQASIPRGAILVSREALSAVFSPGTEQPEKGPAGLCLRRVLDTLVPQDELIRFWDDPALRMTVEIDFGRGVGGQDWSLHNAKTYREGEMAGDGLPSALVSRMLEGVGAMRRAAALETVKNSEKVLGAVGSMKSSDLVGQALHEKHAGATPTIRKSGTLGAAARAEFDAIPPYCAVPGVSEGGWTHKNDAAAIAANQLAELTQWQRQARTVLRHVAFLAEREEDKVLHETQEKGFASQPLLLLRAWKEFKTSFPDEVRVAFDRPESQAAPVVALAEELRAKQEQEKAAAKAFDEIVKIAERPASIPPLPFEKRHDTIVILAKEFKGSMDAEVYRAYPGWIGLLQKAYKLPSVREQLERGAEEISIPVFSFVEFLEKTAEEDGR